jgi:hypothetical protein
MNMTTPLTRWRPVAAVAVIAGAVLTQSPIALMVALIGIVALTAPPAAVRETIRRAWPWLTPIVALLFIVWPGLVQAPPGKPIHSDPHGSLVFASLVALRLLLVSTVLVSSIVAIPEILQPAVFRMWGAKGARLLLICGSLALPAELSERARRVVDARFARGTPSRRTIIARVRHLPYVVRTLVIWSLDTAIGREEEWARRHLADRLTQLPAPAPTSSAYFRDGATAAIGLALVTQRIVELIR